MTAMPSGFRLRARPACGGLLLSLLVAATPVGAQMPTGTRPLWLDHPKSDDSIFLYQIGESPVEATREKAREAALADARDQLIRDILNRAGIAPDDHPLVRSRIALTRLEPVPGAWHSESTLTGYRGWLQVSFPLTDRNALITEAATWQADLHEARRLREAFDTEMNRAWEEARSAFARGEHNRVVELLESPLRRYAEIHQPAFVIEEAQMLRADAYASIKNQVEARADYEAVAQLGASPEWREKAQRALEALPKPPRAWPLRGRLGGRSILLVCARQVDDNPAMPFPPLTMTLTRDFKEVALSLTEDASPEAAAAAAQHVHAYDTQALVDLARAQNTGAVLALLVHHDTARAGTTQEIGGMALPVPDLTISIALIDAATGTVVYQDRFVERSGNTPDARLAERITTIALTKYLLPKCPALPQTAAPVPAADL